MFEFEPDGSYMMPAHFGPRPVSPKSSGWYRDVTMMVIPFVTDRDRLAAYLPEPYEVAEDAVVIGSTDHVVVAVTAAEAVVSGSAVQ